MGTNIFSQLTTATSFQSSSSISVNVWGPTMGCYIILLMVASQRRHVQQQGRPAGTNLHLFSVKRAGAHTAAAERNVCARIKSAGCWAACVRAPIFTCAIFAKINYAPPSGFPCYFFFFCFLKVSRSRHDGPWGIIIIKVLYERATKGGEMSVMCAPSRQTSQ
jgi:hypothetical protein